MNASTALRIANIELDGPTPTTTEPEESSLASAPALAPAADPNHETRQDAARKACVDAGITWPPTILPEGTALFSSGEETLRADRRSWARLPDARTALTAIKNTLIAEDRRDFPATVGTLRIDPRTGRVVRAQNLDRDTGPDRGLGYDDHSFRQLVAQIPCAAASAGGPRGLAGTLLWLQNDERAAIINPRIAGAAADVTLRTKAAHSGGRVLRAVLSRRYADVDDVSVAESIEAALAGEAGNVRLDYQPGDAHSRFELIWPSEIPVETFRVGDVHKVVIQISNSETGEGSMRVTPALYRAACANLTLSTGVGVALRHVGKPEVLRAQVRAAIAAAARQIEPLIATIQLAARTALPEEPVGEIFAKLARKFEIPANRASEWNNVYGSRYAHSPTVWGLTSAITEAAQGREWWHAQAEEEHVASQVLHVGIQRALAAKPAAATE